MRTFFHKITFHDRDRNKMIISDVAIVRLKPDYKAMFEYNYYFGCVQLQRPVENTDREYLETEVFKPQAVQRWDGIQFIYDKPDDTEIYIRVAVDSTDYFYDGGSWAAAAPGEWNTIDEVQANFNSVPVSNDGVKIKIAPSSTGSSNPSIFEIRIVWSGFVSELENILINSLVGKLKTIVAIGDLTTDAIAAGVRVPFDPSVDLDGFNFIEIVVAYNDRTDAEHKLNIFDSFDESQKEIVITEPAEVGDTIFVKFSYNPKCQIAANQDYYEVAGYPVITLEGIIETAIRRPNGKETIVTGFSPNRTGFKFSAARQSDFEITLGIISQLNVDQTRLPSETVTFLEALKILTLTDTDERVDLILVDLYKSNFIPGRSDVRRGEIVLRLLNVTFWNDPEAVAFTDRFIIDVLSNDNPNSDSIVIEKE